MNKDKLAILDTVGRAEVHPWLLTRILEKAAQQQVSRLSRGWSWSLGIAVLLIFMINVAVVLQREPQQDEVHHLVQSMDLLPGNAIYQ